ncbi:TonB-dependent siderophore receptor, partial [Pseudacidovorax intermedius]|uniref:TonB-dependent siderophore receptor n=1 Tax=Pseudacidovorax intermedius TaxID=433924 RepID=UPI0005B7C881
FGATAVRTAYFAPAYTNWRHAGWDPSIPNIHLWNGLAPREPYNPQVGTDDSDERLNSAYGTVRFKPLDGVAVLLGARVTDWRRQQRSQSWASASLTTTDRRERGVVTPYAALTWDFARDWTAYVSYTDIFKPQNYKTPTGDQIDPQTGASRELGVKGSVLDDRLNLSAAIYESKQDNLAVSIPNTFAPDGSQAYRAVSGTRTRGFEMEASGELRPGWQVSAGFSRNMTRDRDGQRLLTNVAQNNVKLATSWRMAGVGNGLTVGGALRWQSAIYADNLGPARNQRFEQPAYAVVDLMLKYPFTPQLSATLNVFNVFDKRYYNTTGNSYWAAPRQLRLGVEARF